MGYTHYWYRPAKLDKELFNRAIADCQKICQALPIPLGNWDGKGKPTISASKIEFNGHIHSEGFCREGDGLIWPDQHAEAVASAGESVINGAWCAGSTTTARCVNAQGDGSYETFSIGRILKKPQFASPVNEPQFEFCKTNYRPYDLNVQCCLIVFKHYFGDQFKVRSDGEMTQWHEACNDCQAVLGYGLDFELDKD